MLSLGTFLGYLEHFKKGAEISISPLLTYSNLNLFFFFNVGPLKEDIFLTTFYGLYFNQWCTYILQITFQLWAYAALQLTHTYNDFAMFNAFALGLI